MICVSTQLIEAGVDIDFGSVIRYLAGMTHLPRPQDDATAMVFEKDLEMFRLSTQAKKILTN